MNFGYSPFQNNSILVKPLNEYNISVREFGGEFELEFDDKRRLAHNMYKFSVWFDDNTAKYNVTDNYGNWDKRYDIVAEECNMIYLTILINQYIGDDQWVFINNFLKEIKEFYKGAPMVASFKLNESKNILCKSFYKHFDFNILDILDYHYTDVQKTLTYVDDIEILQNIYNQLYSYMFDGDSPKNEIQERVFYVLFIMNYRYINLIDYYKNGLYYYDFIQLNKLDVMKQIYE